MAESRGTLIPGRRGDVYDTAALTEDNELTIALKSLGALMMGVDEAILKDFNAATRTFINEGGTLTLTLTPEEPVSLAKLMDTPSLAKKDTLGLTFTHTKPEPEE